MSGLILGQLASQFPIVVRFTVIKIEFTPEEIDALEYELYYHPDPKAQKKMEALYLKSQGVEHPEICRLCRISKTTLATY